MTLKRCPVPLCGGEGVQVVYNNYLHDGRVECPSCGFGCALRYWQALSRCDDLRPAPICPKCGGGRITWTWFFGDEAEMLARPRCASCGHEGNNHPTVDLAIDSWRPEK